MATRDIYEGMIHVFRAELPDTLESKTAIGRVSAFLDQHLRPRSA
jgi:hypothetical protein